MVQIENAIGLMNIIDGMIKGNVMRLAVSGANYITMDADGSVFAWICKDGKPLSAENQGGTSMYRDGPSGGWLVSHIPDYDSKCLFFLGDILIERFPGLDYTQMCFEVIDSDLSEYIAGWEA